MVFWIWFEFDNFCRHGHGHFFQGLDYNTIANVRGTCTPVELIVTKSQVFYFIVYPYYPRVLSMCRRTSEISEIQNN